MKGNLNVRKCVFEIRISYIALMIFVFCGAILAIPGDVLAETLDDSIVNQLTAEAYMIYRDYHGDSGNIPAHDRVEMEDITTSGKAHVLYWYQYNVPDSSISSEDNYHVAKREYMKEAGTSLFGSFSNADWNEFESSFVEKAQDDILYMNSSGDFGDAGPYYFTPDRSMVYDEWDFLMIWGNVNVYNSETHTYEQQRLFRADFSQGSGTVLDGWQFVRVSISENMLSLTPN